MSLELEKISKDLRERYGISEKMECEELEMEAESLLTSHRFDLGAKLYYIQCYVTNQGLSLAEDLYRAHMVAMQYHVQEEQEFQLSVQKSLENFQDMIHAFQNNFDAIEYRVILGKGKEIIDGAHFVACCIYFKKKVPCLYFSGLTGEIFDFLYFKKNGCTQGYLELLAGSFAKYRKDCVGRLSVNGQNKYKTLDELQEAIEEAGCQMVYGTKTRCGRERGWYYIFYSRRKKRLDEEVCKQHFEDIKKMLWMEEKEQLQKISVSQEEKNRWIETKRLREYYVGVLVSVKKLFGLPIKMDKDGYQCLKIKKKK